MNKSERKKLSKQKISRIVFLSVMLTLTALFILGLFLFDSRYPEIYDSPRVHNGTVDFKDTDLPSRDVACNLAGEWEFFYNKWIVTDDTGEPDGMISLPDVWTYKDFGNGKLPRSGYASYRLCAKNIQSGVDIIVYRNNSDFAYRVFINGALNSASGTVSKDASKTVVTGKTELKVPYRTDGSPVEIVIEVSANNVGGLNAAPWLAATSAGISYGNGWRSVNYTALGITTAAVIISILSYAFFFKRDVTVPAFMLALYLHFLFSKDMMFVLGVAPITTAVMGFISAAAAVILFAAHIRRCGAPIKKLFIITAATAGGVFSTLLFAFYGTPLAPVFAFALFAVGSSILFPIALNKNFSTLQYVVYGIIFLLMMSVFFFELSDRLGLLVFGTEFIFTFELMAIMGCLAVLYLYRSARTAKSAMRASELERELDAVKSQALIAQIKPHFIYNSLTAIQAQYRESLNEGDKAIEQFASHLRLITDSKSDDLIPFDDEVRNVLNYFELENLRSGGKLSLFLDIDYSDFSVPVLSIQPLVENAVKHGKDDGHITLSSHKSDAIAVVTVRDNGHGFDTATTRDGVGLTNTKKRLELINATLTVESDEGGTIATIKIPLE